MRELQYLQLIDGSSVNLPSERGQMGSSRGIKVLGERTDTSSMVLGTFLRKKPKVSTTGSFKLTVGHGGC